MASITERAAQSWGKEGKIKKIGHGKYNIKDAFEFVLQRDVFQGGTSNNEVSDEEMRANKALLEKAKADLAETEVGIEKQRLIDRKEIGGYLADQMIKFKKELLSLSRVIPGVCYGMDENEIADEIERRVQKIYNERFDQSELSSFLQYLEDSK